MSKWIPAPVIFALVVASAFQPFNAYGRRSASGTATARTTVLPQMALQKTRDLEFGSAVQGEEALDISPGAVAGAQFSVAGQPGHAYSIVLPESIQMTTPGNPADSILISRFRSLPARTGNLNSSGTDTIAVGATRAAVKTNATSGEYSGEFTVTVTYQ